MRIVCPTCSATYEVPDSLMTPGRVVRCAQCGADWTPLPKQPEVEPPAPPPRVAPAALPEPVPESTEPAAVQTVQRSAMARLAAHPAQSGPSLALRVAWAGSIVLLLLVIAVAFAWRSRIVDAWPASTRAYSALGLHPPQPGSSR